MRILKHRFNIPSRSTTINIIPLGDIHIGAAACDEDRLQNVINRIKDDPNCYWYGMGDYCDFINMRDPRANTGTLANWIGVKDLSDLVAAQKDRFLDFIKPIAHKCLGLVEGNHETSIHRFYERDIYSEIVTAIKQWKNLPIDQPLAVGYYGWSLLYFQRGAQTNMVKVNLHHGYVGGKLAGAKALEMQRWLWSHDADIVIFGHSHNTNIQIEQSEGINDAGDLVLKNRYGVYAGSFLKTVNENGASTYSEVKGYLPMPTAGVQIMIRPGAFDSADSTRSEPISVMTGVV